MDRLLRLVGGIAWFLLAVRWVTLGMFAAGIASALSLAWVLVPIAVAQRLFT